MTKTTAATPQSDFYDYINADWLKKAQIPTDKPATGSFNQLAEAIEILLMADFAPYLDNQELPEQKELANFIKFYRLANDYQKRNEDGAAPLLPYLKKIEDLTSLNDFQKELPEWLLDNRPTPFPLTIDVDMKNTKKQVFFASAPQLFLPDKSYYDADNQQGARLLVIFKDMMIKLFGLAGKTLSESEKIVMEGMAFDALLAPHMKSSEENADILASYNPQTIKEFSANSAHIDFTSLLTNLVGETPSSLILTDLAYYQAFNQLVTPENFGLLKSWMLIVETLYLSNYLSEEFRRTAAQFGQAVSGSAEITKPNKAAYYLGSDYFDQVIGVYYGNRYFGQGAKKDVLLMVKQMVDVYEERLKVNSWLKDETKGKAITKLQHLGIQVGYPEEIPPLYRQFVTKTAAEGGTLLSNGMRFSRLRQEDNFQRYHQEVDRLEWEMSGDTVNAYYHPFKNIIVFPAAILQEPFYSLTQSSSANYGGIGAVIAHEISHAFDNNGASFDEYGNLNNWWSDADLTYFKKLAQQMIEQFDDLPMGSGKVNGTMTVSENIADAGGLSCALEAAKKDPTANLVDFFRSWATIWRMKASPEYIDLLLTMDVHGPNKLRANIQPQNLEDFYQTFNIQEHDPMYRQPEKRISIW